MPEPYQQIAQPDNFALPCVVLPDVLDESAIRDQVQALIAQPFDLAHGPLLRATLFQRNLDEHILVLVIHHAVFDGWSQNVLLRELSARRVAQRFAGGCLMLRAWYWWLSKLVKIR